jgi:predicted unusual protein kinase regulating ubiquinone biosynthesis (AarF/ABC1/UbiB family)
VNQDGKLCLIDFGLCADVDERARNAMTKAIVHLITQDFDTLISKDSKELGFLPDDFDTTELKPLLTKILTVGLIQSGSDLRKRHRNLKEISSELNEVFFRYPFSGTYTTMCLKIYFKLWLLFGSRQYSSFDYFPFPLFTSNLVPPFFALVTRGLGLLEGIALSGDPEFDIFKASAPYARRRAISMLGPDQYLRMLTRTRSGKLSP